MPTGDPRYHDNSFRQAWSDFKLVEDELVEALRAASSGAGKTPCLNASNAMRGLEDSLGRMYHHGKHIDLDAYVEHGDLTVAEAEQERKLTQDRVKTAERVAKNLRKKFITRCSRAT